MEKDHIDSLREACGTLPNRKPQKQTPIYHGCEKLEVEIVDEPKNAYKAIFHIATATWGDEQYKNKWRKLQPIQRYIVVMNALAGKTLPTALEAPKYTFRIKGLPRNCFDQEARTRIGAGFGSIGCRDNSKLDTSIILYSEYENFPEDLQKRIKDHLEEMKDLYEEIIDQGGSSWQVARSILVMGYHHPWIMTQNLMSLIGQCRRRMCFGEEEFIAGLHWQIRRIFEETGMKLIANAMRPACDKAGKCLYSKSDGTELFSNLFAGCGRWTSDSEYSEFNKSCTDKDRLEDQLGMEIPLPFEYINFTSNEAGYEKLGIVDKQLFEED